MAAKKKTSRTSAKKPASPRKKAKGTGSRAKSGGKASTRLTPAAQKAVDDVREQAQAYMQPALKKLAKWARDVV